MAEESSPLVLLGFVDQAIKDEGNIDWTTNKIGGESIFPQTIDDNQLSTFMTDQLTCPNCVKLCSLICQIQSAVDDNAALRVIYVFACLEDNCNHFSVLRFVHHQPLSPLNFTTIPKVSSQRQLNQRQIWDTDSSNWSDEEIDGENLNSLGNNSEELFTESLELSNIQKGKFLPKNLSNGSYQTFHPYYIYVENLEDLKCCKSYLTKKQSKYNMDDGDEDNVTLTNEEGEKYENPEVSTIFANDQVSYKFYKSLRDWPGQIIRYSWKGQPLLNKSIVNPRIDDCPNCGCKRTFEFQLMPGLISQLKLLPSSKQSTKSLNIDFGTVLIYCCSNNCDNQPFNEEKWIFLEDLDNNVINGFVSSRG